MFSNAAETFIRLGAEFHRRGWVRGPAGISAPSLRVILCGCSLLRVPWIKAASLPIISWKSNRTADAVNGRGGKPSAETLLHIAVVRATGAASVLHTHSVWGTVLSDLHADEGGFFIEGYEMLKGLEGVTTHEHRSGSRYSKTRRI